MVFGLDRPISVICSDSRSPPSSKKRPLQPINDTNMATSRVTSAHARSRVRSRQSLEERVTRHAQQPHTPEVNGVDTDLEKLMISKRQLDFKLDDFEMLNTLGTGTFGRVVLTKHKASKEYYALKILTISEVIRLKQVEHVRSEKAILLSVMHPFIVDMMWTYHNEKFLYMLLEFICGGELFSYLRNAGRFNNATGNFYAAEIVSALDYLHSKTIVYRDLKPENLLLDREGHLKLTDFGFAKTLNDRTWTLCGTPEYLAPEIIQSKGHNKAVDWWALGILIYEMLVGYPPFYDDKPFGIYEKILAGKIEWPKHMDPVGKDLIRKLLVQDRTKRLGNMKNGSDDVKNHKWFRLLRWDVVFSRKLDPPIVPRVRHRGDTRNFFDYPETNWQNFVEPPIVPPVDHDGDTKNFDQYSENNWQLAQKASKHDIALFHDF